MYRIRKQFHFSASHQLTNLPSTHPCTRLHGHNYTVEVQLQADTLNAAGFVVDYNDLKELKVYIDKCFDHQHLNNVLLFQPSAEYLALHFYVWCKEQWPQTVCVRVSETESTWAEYTESEWVNGDTRRRAALSSE